MEERNKLISEMIQTTNDLNNKYCDIYDMLYSQKLGQKNNYDNIMKELNHIETMLNKQKDERNKLTVNEYETLKMMDILIKYQNLLGTRINVLQIICNNFKNKAEGIRGKYSIFAYYADHKKLKKMETESAMLGNSLQSMAVPFMRKYRQ